MMIPRSKMPEDYTEYRSEGVYVFRGDESRSYEEIKIDRGSKFRCRVFELKT